MESEPSVERPSPNVGTFGLVLFLLGMTFAFAWLIYGYLIVRRDFPGVEMVLPVWLWFSTFFVLVSSVTLQSSLVLARMNNARHARRALMVSVGLGFVFALLQVPGLVELVAAHHVEADPQARLYRMIFMLALVHIAHVFGGLGYMVTKLWQLRAVPIDVRQRPVLRNLAIFWHYLAIVWLVMFTAFIAGGGVRPFYEL